MSSRFSFYFNSMTRKQLFFVADLLFLTMVLNIVHSEKVVVLDTRETKLEEWGFKTHRVPGKTRDGWYFESKEKAYRVCDTEVEDAKNALTSPYIDVSQTAVIEIAIFYLQQDCSAVNRLNNKGGNRQPCSNDLKLKYKLVENNVPVYRREKVDPFKFEKTLQILKKEEYDEYATQWDLDTQWWYQKIELGVGNSSGVYLGFEDSGSCTTLYSMQVKKLVCPEVVSSHAHYPASFGLKDTRVEATRCVAGASVVEGKKRPIMICDRNGGWIKNHFNPDSCQCNPGYEPLISNKYDPVGREADADQNCEACKPDHFKSTHDNSQCEKCPMNSKSEEGSAICNCNKGYYRAVNASAKAICDKPPRAPVIYGAPHVDNTDVTIKWEQPDGLVEYFTVQCDLCKWERYRKVMPLAGAGYGRAQNQVTLRNLRPFTRHTVVIYSENYLTRGQRRIAKFIDTQFTTGKQPSINQLQVHQLPHSQKIALSWVLDPPINGEPASSFRSHNGPSVRSGSEEGAVRFNIHVHRNGDLLLIYTCITTYYELSLMQSGSYQLKVCLDNSGNRNSGDHNDNLDENGVDNGDVICSEQYPLTIEETYNSLAEPRSIVLGGALLMGAILLILMVMLMSIWFYRRHAQATGGVGGSYCQGTYGFGGQLMNTFGHGANIGGHDWKLMTSVNELGRLAYGGQTFMEPGVCDEPEKLLFEFSREIFPEQIQFHTDQTQGAGKCDGALDLNSGLTGCFSALNPNILLQKATLNTLENQSCGVVVKSVSDCGVADLECMRLFLVEAATQAQFNHPNVQMLHGTMLQMSQVVVCVEWASQGQLDLLMRDDPLQFTLMQLIHILRGITCGMQYLSELAYVHKVLTSGNVLLTGTGVPKISGFDMRTALDQEEATGSKPRLFSLLLPWMAPEVIASYSYSTQSDVYSFGVLMYEVLHALATATNSAANTTGGYVQQHYQIGGHPDGGKMTCSEDLTNPLSKASPGTQQHQMLQGLPADLPPPSPSLISSNTQNNLSQSQSATGTTSTVAVVPQFLLDVISHCLCQDSAGRPSFGYLRETLEKVVRNSNVLLLSSNSGASLTNNTTSSNASGGTNNTTTGGGGSGVYTASIANQQLNYGTNSASVIRDHPNGQYLPLEGYYPAGFDPQMTLKQQQPGSPFMTQKAGKKSAHKDPNSTIEDWLVYLKMGQYTNLFYSRNLFLVKDLFGSTNDSLELLGVSSLKHRKRMVSSLNAMVNATNSANKKKQSTVHIII